MTNMKKPKFQNNHHFWIKQNQMWHPVVNKDYVKLKPLSKNNISLLWDMHKQTSKKVIFIPGSSLCNYYKDNSEYGENL